DAMAAVDRIVFEAQNKGERFDNTLLQDIIQDPTSSIYYAETVLMGHVGSVFSFHNLEWLGYAPVADIFNAGIQDAAVVLVDGISSFNQRYFALLIETVAADGFKDYFITVSAPNSFVFSKND